MTNTTTTEFPAVLVNGQPMDLSVMDADDDGQLVAIDYDEDWGTHDEDPFCFVCGRSTDHVAEHDDLVDEGLVAYEHGGFVVWTPEGRGWFYSQAELTAGGR